jgi:hypothetical protein
MRKWRRSQSIPGRFSYECQFGALLFPFGTGSVLPASTQKIAGLLCLLDAACDLAVAHTTIKRNK